MSLDYSSNNYRPRDEAPSLLKTDSLTEFAVEFLESAPPGLLSTKMRRRKETTLVLQA